MRWFRTVGVALVAGAGLLTAAVAGGMISVVTTHGNSMEPRIHAGDLVLTKRTPTYAVGDSAAYHSDAMDTVVLHRIVAVEGGRYTFQGDNNSWLDPERPTIDQLLGKEFLHIPRAGLWLDQLTGPSALGLLAFVLVTTGFRAAHTRDQRGAHPRRRTVSQHAARSRGRRPMAALPSWAYSTASAAAVTGALGLLLGVAAWNAPTAGGTAADSTVSQQMVFSYSASVPESPAYDDTTVTSPQPVFRKLTDTVEVRYAYTGAPGSVSVVATLSTAGGWASTLPLGGKVTFRGDRYTGSATLNLKDLHRRALDAAAVTGMPADQVDVKIAPTVITEGTAPFKPTLGLTLTPLQLKLNGDPSALTVRDPTSSNPADASTTPTLNILGRQLPVSTARLVSLGMVVGALLAASLVALVLFDSRSAPQTAVIRRRYPGMLLEIEPMPAAVGHPVIDVVDFAALAKLAERYNLLVLHWTHGDTETFVVQDQSTVYRYRTSAALDKPAPEMASQAATHQSALAHDQNPEL